MPRFSTFSIAACDLEEKTWGVAVASKFPAVGAAVPGVNAEVGAVATQRVLSSLGAKAVLANHEIPHVVLHDQIEVLLRVTFPRSGPYERLMSRVRKARFRHMPHEN